MSDYYNPEELVLIRKQANPRKPKPEAIPEIATGGLPVSTIADTFSDMRLSAGFAEMFHDKIRYWPEVGKWLIFDGCRWTTDAPAGAFPFIRQMIETLFQKAGECADYAARQEMLKAIFKLVFNCNIY